MFAGVTPFGLHRLPVIYRAFGTACANCYIIANILANDIRFDKIIASCFLLLTCFTIKKTNLSPLTPHLSPLIFPPIP